jgi:hypothetical protein
VGPAACGLDMRHAAFLTRNPGPRGSLSPTQLNQAKISGALLNLRARLTLGKGIYLPWGCVRSQAARVSSATLSGPGIVPPRLRTVAAYRTPGAPQHHPGAEKGPARLPALPHLRARSRHRFFASSSAS